MSASASGRARSRRLRQRPAKGIYACRRLTILRRCASVLDRSRCGVSGDRTRHSRPECHAALQPCRLREVDAESVPAALVAAGHLGAGVAELLLDVALIDLGRGGEAGAQRMSGEFLAPLAFGEIAADAGGKRGALDQPGDVPVGQPVGAGLLAARARSAGTAARGRCGRA